MPIAFPLPERGPPWTWAKNLLSGASVGYWQTGVQYVPNLLNRADLSLPYKQNNFGGLVVEAQRKHPNVRRLDTMFVNAERPQINQVPLNVRFPVVAQQTGRSAFTISGIAYNSTGVTPQAGANIDLFLTTEDTLVQRTVSDAAGAFSFLQMGAGPYYIVAYKAGTPDIAGTTVNTLTPTQVL